MATDVRITDAYTIREVEKIRVSRGDKTTAKTARDLINERLTILNPGFVLEGSAAASDAAQGKASQLKPAGARQDRKAGK